MRGLKSWVNWRTFGVGFLVGYLVAWGVHRAVTFWAPNVGWVEEVVPVVTPRWAWP